MPIYFEGYCAMLSCKTCCERDNPSHSMTVYGVCFIKADANISAE
jgi:hypothetical protein